MGSPGHDAGADALEAASVLLLSEDRLVSSATRNSMAVPNQPNLARLGGIGKRNFHLVKRATTAL
jgi:hypothetical protein